ncbi:hypothetical protein B1R32_11659 [Abditibacterium utsteinense]|uniref:Uncharacterized protein n=1 Tax=Abditibacterium utsteinense TaxID=1960156 RepID=A0A2S8SQK1_9BACT|nr:hypothetical protein B1R32_11659 [Abditibacterium utsteinense]
MSTVSKGDGDLIRAMLFKDMSCPYEFATFQRELLELNALQGLI